MRPLLSIPSNDLARVRAGLEDALRGSGPAIIVLDDASLSPAESRTALPQLVADDIAVVIETSGSSGEPKRVGLSAEALLASARASHGRLGGPGQWLLALPANYVAGLQVLTRSIDSGVDFIGLPGGPFTPEAFCRGVAALDHDRRYSSVVPYQLARLCEFAEASGSARDILGSLDALLVGGQATPADLIDSVRRLGISVVTTYGSTETAGGCVYDGIPLPGVALELDEAGELMISTHMLASEYVSGAPSTPRFLERDGSRWYRTGDTAELVGGNLRVTGRVDRVLISGGVKVSLEAIESVAATVVAGGVVAVSVVDETWGARPVLVIEGTGSDDLESQVRAVVLETSGRVAVPDRIIWVSSIPVLASGKPNLVAAAALASQ